VTQDGGSGTCHPQVLARFPLPVGDIAPGAHRAIELPIDFSKCSANAIFATSMVISSNHGAIVSNVTDAATAK
jgi:alpha-galactosidase